MKMIYICQGRQCIAILIFALTISFNLFSTKLEAGNNYYFSSSMGDDTRTPAQAKNSDTPWKTINKLNSFFSSLLPGDSILFKRGDTFWGSILINKSGTATLPIVISVYGTGAKPVITAFQTVTGWINLGGNKWESSMTNCKSTLNMLTVNGVNTPIGRYPNSGTENGGYLTFESFTPSVSITDNQLTNSPNWTGAEVVIRKLDWIIDRCLISNHTNNTITYANSSTYPGISGWGYFIQNDPKTLDITGEWFLNKTTKKIQMYFNENNPNSFLVKASTLDTLVYSFYKSYITFTNLVFEGANEYGFYLNNGSNIKILSCEIRNIGANAVFYPSNTYLTLNGCIISNINDNVIYGNFLSNNCYVGYCEVSNAGLIPGNAGIGDLHNFGVSIQADNCLAEYNTIRKMGYLGIILGGNNSIIRNNVVDSVCLIKDDGAAIYVNGYSQTVMSGRIVENNIVTNSLGNTSGTTNTIGPAHGIYVDGYGNHVTVQNNTVSLCSMAGIFLGFYSQEINLLNNTLYNNGAYNLLIAEVNNTDNNFVINGNIIATNNNTCLIKADMVGDGTVYRPIESLGTWSGNTYIKPFDDKNIMTVNYQTPKIIYDGVTFNGWSQYDANINVAPVNIIPYVVNNTIGNNRFVNSQFNTNINGLFFGYNSTGVASVTWDNTNKISGGSAKLSYSQISTTKSHATISFNTGAIEAGKKYILKFDVLGTMSNRAVEINLKNANSPYNYLTPFSKYYPYTNVVTTNEVLIEPSETTTAAFLNLRFRDDDSTVYFDNVSFYEANVTNANPDNHLRFEYNATNANKTVALDGTYLGVDSTIFSNNLTLLPYSSVLLFKVIDTSSNHNPSINNQAFQIPENSPNSSFIGTVLASDPDTSQALTFSILSGNINGAFAINPTTGVITVANSAQLNFETTPSFSLIVKVQDNGIGSLSSHGTVTVSLLNINEVPIINNQTYSLSENSANGTVAATVIATDPDTGQTITFSILSGNTNGAFTIHPLSGLITVANSAALNFEANPTISLIIKVQDNGMGLLSTQANISISITDVNEAPVINNQSFSLVENSANGMNVGTIAAADPDAGQTKTFSILSGNTNGAFSIIASTGVLHVANSVALNFEITPSFALTIKVQDNGTGNLSSQATVTVTLSDINEVLVINNQSFSIAENSQNGSNVGTVIALDPDAGQTKTFTILSGNTNSAFAINASSGILTVSNSTVLNFEVSPSFALVIKVQDNGTGNLSSQATIIISLLDLNEAPVMNNQSFYVPEYASVGTSVGTVTAYEPDAGQTLSYSIISGNVNNTFSINALTGELTVTNSTQLNFNSNPTFSLNIKATDNGAVNLFDEAIISINVVQSINQAPVISNQFFSLFENSVIGTIVGTIVATDPDAGQSITYSILSGNTDNAFSINPSTGALTVSNSSVLNFEVIPLNILVVKVQDNGIGNLSSQATINISLIDINEIPSINSQTLTVDESSANGTSVGLIQANDPDAGQILAYSILSGNSNGAFIINPSSGLLSVANTSELDYETVPNFCLIIKVLDNGNLSLSNQATITVSLIDVNEAPAIFNQEFSVFENAANGTNVGTVIATDSDSGQTNSFSIVSGNGNNAFSIDASTGVLMVANSFAINYETTSSFALSIMVQDNGSGNLSSQATITVSLSDANELPVLNNQSFSVAENSVNLTYVGTVVAADPDAGQSMAYSILSGNSTGGFTINPSTGALTVVNSEALNFETTTSFGLAIQVQDNGTGNLSSQAIVTIFIIDVNEAPAISNQSFNVLEFAANGTSVGNIAATDPDANQSLSYLIISGNISSAFAINSSTGEITVTNSSALAYLVNPAFSLLIKVSDNGTGNIFDEANISLNVLQYTNQPPVISNQTFTLDENSVNGTFLGSIQAFDPDAGQALSYSILSGNTFDAFEINPLSGMLIVANSTMINFESSPTFMLIIEAQDNGIGTLSNQALVTISLQDVNEAPIINNQTFSAFENTTFGTIVDTIIATDPDFGQTITFTILSGNANGAFAVNPSNGKITAANSTALNFEANSNFTLVINVQDSGPGGLSSLANVSIIIVDINEPPLVNYQTFNINENLPNGSIVGTFVAADPDAGQTLEYSILSGNTNNDFAINVITGVITVANSTTLNYETIPSFSLSINVQDNGTGNLNSQGIAEISLQDVNEPPIINNQLFSVNENSSNGTIIGNVIAIDPDAGQNISFSIVSGNTGGAFAINGITGSLSVANSVMLDFEVTQSFSLVVKVQDNHTGNLSNQAIIGISLNDVNEIPLINNQAFTIAENSLNGTNVGTVIASDPDQGQVLLYTIHSGNTDGVFSINATTGILLVANSAELNFEASPSFNLIVNVQDNGTGSLNNQSLITVTLIDVNETPIAKNQTFSVSEFSTNGSIVGIVQASDPDEGQLLTYEITSGNTNYAFMLNSSSGTLNVANSNALNYLINSVFVLNVRVTDNGTGNLFDDASVTINVLPVINQPPIILDQTFLLNENSSNGTSVGIVEASDPNTGQLIAYSITSGNDIGVFAINQNTGDLTVSNSTFLNFETNPSFTLIIRVLDNGDPNLSNQAIVTILLVDTNEPPVISNQSFNTPEHQPIGTSVGNVTALDPDSGKPVTFSITSGNTSNGFMLNSVTGILTINNPNAVCFEGTPLFNLIIKATDNEGFSSEAILCINISDINENPVCIDKAFVVQENLPAQTIIATVIATDPDFNQTLAYSIVSGNTNNAFRLNANDGVLKVNNPNAFNYEDNPKFILTVSVQDDGLGNLIAFSTITIELVDVNEPPVIENQVFNILENSPAGKEIGYLVASDPENGQSLTYSIVAGNDNETFDLNATSGLLSVSDPTMLVFDLNPVFSLMIKAMETGSDSLSATSFAIINLLQESSGQIIYIDPTNENDPSENGSIAHPYDSWEDFIFTDGHTYLQKRGTTFKAVNTISIQKSNITIDAYGGGNNPIIYYTDPFENAIELHNAENCQINNFDVSFDHEGMACIKITGDLSKSLTIGSCQLHDALYGIQSVSQIRELKILNTSIYNTVLDGIIADNFESIEVSKCHISDANQQWFTNPNANGTCMKLNSDNGEVYIHDNVLDHSESGNSFVLRLNGSILEGLIENNTLKGRKVSGNHCLGLNNSSGVFTIRYNTIIGGETGINSNAYSSMIYYNQLIENSVAIKVQQNKAVSVINNTFYGNENYSIESLMNSKVFSKNNIYYLTPTSQKAYNFGGTFISDFNVFNVEKAGFLNSYSTLSIWTSITGQDQNSLITDPLFVDIEAENFKIKPNSPCINKGLEFNLEQDFFTTAVPQADIPDIGFYEVSAESILPRVEPIPLEDDKSLIDISLFPNPSIGNIKISFEKTDDQPVNIRILNMNGYEVYTIDIPDQDEVLINLEDEKLGMYLAVITTSGQIFSRKFILQN